LEPPPDVVHTHDWQTALVPLLVRTAPEPRLAAAPTAFTIHNLGYQGIFGQETWPILGLDRRYFTAAGLEFYGRINFLKAGLAFPDRVTTVSPRYAMEIQTPEHGDGLDGVLRERAGTLRGILNGIDVARWDPGHDPFIPATFTSDDLAGKA